MLNFNVLIFSLCFIVPCLSYEIPPSLRPKENDTVKPFLTVTPDGKVIFEPFVLQVDQKVDANPQPDAQTGVSTKDITISPDTGVKARIFLPKITTPGQKLPILVYFHGGAFVTGSAFFSKDGAFHKKVAAQANALIISVEYRLWPDYALPAAYDDGFSALKWLASLKAKPEPNDWVSDNGDFGRVFVGGDSAGGNLAFNVVMRAGKEGLPNNMEIKGLFMGMPYFYGSTPVGSEPPDPASSDIAKLWKYVCPMCPGGIDNPWLNPFAPGAPCLSQLKCNKVFLVGGTKDMMMGPRTKWFAEEAKKHGYGGNVEYYEGEGNHVFYIMEGDLNPATKVVVDRLTSFMTT